MAGSPSRVIPGFSLTLGYTLFYLSALVLIPLAALVLKTTEMSFAQFWAVTTDPIVLASYRLTFTASFLAALINGIFGLIVAWALVRYQFPGGRFFDALIDFPFALPTAVAGLTYASLYLKDGWIGGIGPRLVAGVNARRRLGRAGAAARARGAGLADLSLHRGHDRHRAGSDFRRPALRRAHRPAGPDRMGSGIRDRRAQSRRRPLHDLPPRDLPGAVPRLDLGLRAGLRPGHRRIRLRHFHRVQHSGQIADRAAADRHQARRFPICGGRGHRRGAARHFPAHPARDQRCGSTTPAATNARPDTVPRKAIPWPEP